MKFNHPLRFTVPNRVEYLTFIDKALVSMAEALGFEKSDVTKIELGLEEAFVNILETAFMPGEEETLDIILQPETTGLKIILKEKGIPFDPKQLDEYDPNELKDNMSERGLGIFLMQKFVDEVSFLNLGKEGKETHLFKYFNQQSVEKLMSDEELVQAKEAISEEPLPRYSVEFTVREIEEKEAIEISKCAFSSYGYSYINEDIYFPDRIWNKNQTGELISLVPVTTDNKIMGHVALEVEDRDPRFPQLGMVFVMPRYQGQGCMNKVVPMLIEKGIKKGFVGIYARGITTHPYSQKSLLKFGFKETALLLSSGPEREYKGIVEGKTQRESVMLLSHYLQPVKPYRIFVSERHSKMVQCIYDNLEIDVEVVDNFKNSIVPKIVPKYKHSVIYIQTESVNGVAHIVIEEFGSNVFNEINQNLRSLCIDRFETIYLHLKMADPLVVDYVAEFEKMFFFFGGVMPSSDGNDELILQYLNNYRINYEKVTVASEMAQELKEYIFNLDPNQEM